MAKPKISILVAVYNAEKYLRRCLDSLVNQTLSEIEIICIDDCSADSSLSILREYAEKDSRLTILTNDRNLGPSRSRNRGLEIATGEFITMLDSDDWFSNDSLSQVYNKFLSDGMLDCVLFDLMIASKDEDETDMSRYECPSYETLSGYDAFVQSIRWNIHGLYAVRTDIHKQYPYDETSLLYSDDNTTLLHYVHSRRVGFCSGKYYYRQNPDSMTHTVSMRRFDRLEADQSLKRILSDVDPHLSADYETHRWLNLVGCCYYLHQHHSDFGKDEKMAIRQRIAMAYDTIERKHIEPRHKYKLGYYPFRSYQLFRAEEWIYFSLKDLLH